jgi:hypothetical protein
LVHSFQGYKPNRIYPRWLTGFTTAMDGCPPLEAFHARAKVGYIAG